MTVEYIIDPDTRGNAALAVQFREFIAKAATTTSTSASGASIEDFQSFISEAMPLLFAGIRRLLPEIAERATLAARWLTNDDLLAVAGFRWTAVGWRAVGRRCHAQTVCVLPEPRARPRPLLPALRPGDHATRDRRQN